MLHLRIEPFGILIKDFYEEKIHVVNKSGVMNILLKKKYPHSLDAEKIGEIREFTIPQLLDVWNSDFGSAFLSAPEYVTWDITSRCNLNCSHCCSNSSIDNDHGLPGETIVKAIDELARMKVFSISWGGGEPFIRDDFLDICRYVDKKGIAQGIPTNGTLLDERKIRELKQLDHLGHIQLSLDGSHPGIHDRRRRVKGAWKQTIEAVRMVKDQGLRCGINTVVSEDNIQDLENIVGLCIDFNVDFYRMIGMVYSGRGKKAFMNDIYLDIERRIDEVRSKFLEKLTIYTSKKGENNTELMDAHFIPIPGQRKLCPAGVIQLHIDSDGNILPCSYYEELSLGNISHDSIQDVWYHSEELKNIRCVEEFHHPVCEECSSRENCYEAGCRAEAINLFGRIDSPNPECPHIRKFLRDTHDV